MKALTSRLALGTAQFGSKYGINNKTGKVSLNQAFQILYFAARNGLDVLDTAGAYGNSEELIGEFLKRSGAGFKVISKFSRTEEEDFDLIPKFERSLKRLGTKSLYGYLIHQFSDYERTPRIWDELKGLQKEKKVQKVGFSLYSPAELSALLKAKVKIDLVQVPYSIFDRRFEKEFAKLKKQKVEIHVRSVFLQGAAFMAPPELPSHLLKLKASLVKLRDLALSNRVPLSALFLNFVAVNPNIDRIVVGVDSLQQFNQNLADVRPIPGFKKLLPELKELAIEDENVLLPYRWPVK